MSVVTRWEKERAAWVLGRSRAGTSARRRAEMLGRRARRLGRSGTGVAETSLREEITPPLFRRLLSTDQGTGEQIARFFGLLLGLAVIGLTVGPALALAAAIYGVLWQNAPRIGRLWYWPWLVAGGASALVGVAVIALAGKGTGVWLASGSMSVHVYIPMAIPFWVWTQLTLALLFAGGHIWRTGWLAVPVGAKPKPIKDKNGDFIKTPDSKKVKLDPLSGVGVSVVETKVPEPKEAPEAAEATAAPEAPAVAEVAAPQAAPKPSPQVARLKPLSLALAEQTTPAPAEPKTTDDFEPITFDEDDTDLVITAEKEDDHV